MDLFTTYSFTFSLCTQIDFKCIEKCIGPGTEKNTGFFIMSGALSVCIGGLIIVGLAVGTVADRGAEVADLRYRWCCH